MHSAGRCAFPGCRKPLVAESTPDDGPVTIGIIAHIHAHSEGGPRYSPQVAEPDRYPNLVLLCGDHHSLVDGQASTYAADDLRGWKQDLEDWVAAVLGAATLPPLPPGVPAEDRGFQGRSPLLDAIEEIWGEGDIAVLVGPPGIGKSATASHCFYRAAGFTTRAWWVRGADVSTLASDLAAAAPLFGLLPIAGESEFETAQRVRHHLETTSDWLLVVDDAVPTAEVADLLPRRTAGRLLMTSRSPEWGGPGRVLQVPVLDVDECRAIFALLHQPGGPDHDQLAELLGGLPLAVVQAARYMALTGTTAARYIGLLEDHLQDLMARGTPVGQESLAATIAIALGSLGSAARELLNLLSVLSAAPVPSSMLGHAATGPAAALQLPYGSPIAMNDAVAELVTVGLCHHSPIGLERHRVIHHFVHQGLSPEELKLERMKAAMIVAELLPGGPNSYEDRRLIRAMDTHLYELSSAAELGDPLSIGLATALNRLGLALGELGEDTGALRALQDARRLLSPLVGHEDEVISTSARSLLAAVLTNTGNIHKHLRDLPAAEAALLEALTIRDAMPEEPPEMVAITLGALGQCLLALGSLQQAREVFERAHDLLSPIADAHPRRALETLSDLVWLSSAEGEDEDEAAHLDQMFELLNRHFPADSPEAADVLLDLHQTLRRHGYLDEALEVLLPVVNICIDELGVDHPRTAMLMMMAAPELARVGRGDDAQHLADVALPITSVLHGESSWEYGRALGNYGAALAQGGSLEDAIPYLRDALSILDETVAGPADASIAVAKADLGWTLFQMGELDEALELTEAAVQMARSENYSEAAAFEVNLRRMKPEEPT